MDKIERVENAIQDLRNQLRTHRLYNHLNTIEDVKLFTESHVFAVWDFMSLLKALQIRLTTVQIPWTPAGNPILARFINEVVHAEESDVNELGEPKSHFEMYLDAMKELGANTEEVDILIEKITRGEDIIQAIKELNVSHGVKNFLEFTFSLINSGESHLIASAFTFGREDVIPDMFIEILNSSGSYPKLKYYLERHIELDGDEHGPLSLQLVAELCGDDQQKWDEVIDVAKKALTVRVELWDSINMLILKKELQADFA